jgi:hypothetical protein
MAVKTGQIPEKFKFHRRRVQELRVSDRQFHDLWADYCEVLNIVGPAESRTAELRRLQDELEQEIHEALQKNV